jgi:transcriptional regulator with XRE-family HTH domain
MAKRTKAAAGSKAARIEYGSLVLKRPQGTSGRRSRLYPELNLRELAHRAEVDPSYFGRVLSGKQRPSLPVAQRIAAVLGVPIEEIAAIPRKTMDEHKTK